MQEPMSDLIDTSEMYLKSVYELLEEGLVPMRARIAERLGHSGPTVSETVARMERDGLLRLTEQRHLEFTPAGLAAATAVMRRHRLAERLLADTLGVSLDLVHEEACRWEHVMTDIVTERVAASVTDPSSSPYGLPIPGAEDPVGTVPGMALAEVAEVADAQAQQVRLVAISEIGQADPQLLELLVESGLVPGANVEILRADDEVQVRAVGHDPVVMSREFATHLRVETAC